MTTGQDPTRKRPSRGASTSALTAGLILWGVIGCFMAAWLPYGESALVLFFVTLTVVVQGFVLLGITVLKAMKKGENPWWLGAVPALLLVILVTFSASVNYARSQFVCLPPDVPELVKHFDAHRAEFEALVLSLRAGSEPTPETLQSLRLKRAIVQNDAGDCEMVVHSRKILVDTSVFGYAYLDTPPHKIVTSIACDMPTPGQLQLVRHYQALGGRWYLVLGLATT